MNTAANRCLRPTKDCALLNRIELLEISFALDIHFFVNVIFYFPITTITIKDLLYCELYMGNLKGFFPLLYSSVKPIKCLDCKISSLECPSRNVATGFLLNYC